MGMDALDVAFRLENAFGIKWERHDHERMWAPAVSRSPDFPDLTAGEIHGYVCRKLREAGRPIPHSSWHRVQKVLAESLRTPPKDIKPGTYIRKELGHD